MHTPELGLGKNLAIQYISVADKPPRSTEKQKMHVFLKMAAGTILLAAFHQSASPCTAFSLRSGTHLTACFNFDFQFGAGHVYVNKRNTERQRFLLYAERPIWWTSKYGSITFNLVGRDWPHDGMNEAGLVVLSMGLDDTKFLNPDDRFAIDENGWVQYQLDNSASVGDVLDNMKKLRISNRSIGDSHFLVVDSTGRALVVEYVDGREEIYADDKLPYAILANDTYSHMLDYLNQQKAFGGTKEDKFRVSSSCCRFARVADRMRQVDLSTDSMIDYGLAILGELKQSNTQYQVAYDITGRKINYRSRSTNDLKSISFSEYDFSCNTPVLMADIQSAGSGDIRNDFSPFDSGRSRLALAEFNMKTFEYLPEEALAGLVETSGKSKCRDGEAHTRASEAKGQSKEITGRGAIIASLHKPKTDRVVVSTSGANLSLDFDVGLNRPAEEDIDLVLEVPDSSGLTPGDNVFVTPNPVRIEKGRASEKVRAIIILNRLQGKSGKYLIVNLLSDGAEVGNEKQFRIQVGKDAKTR